MRASSSWPSASESRARSAEPRDGSLPRVLDFGAQPQLELSGGLLGEGHGDDSAKLGAPARQRRDDPVDQRGGLAGAGGGLDDERGVEVVADAVAHALVGNLARRAVGVRRFTRSKCFRCAHRNFPSA